MFNEWISGLGETLTRREIIDVARGAGFPESSVPDAVAIAFAESSGRREAIGDQGTPRAGCASYGLWQINVCPGREEGDPFDPAKLLDPDYNARAAYVRSSGGANWRPWTTYRTGRYRAFLKPVESQETIREEDTTPVTSSEARLNVPLAIATAFVVAALLVS